MKETKMLMREGLLSSTGRSVVIATIAVLAGMAIGAIGAIAAQQQREDYYNSYGYGPGYYGGGNTITVADHIMVATIIGLIRFPEPCFLIPWTWSRSDQGGTAQSYHEA
jgi:hypothetical protein